MLINNKVGIHCRLELDAYYVYLKSFVWNFLHSVKSLFYENEIKDIYEANVNCI